MKNVGLSGEVLHIKMNTCDDDDDANAWKAVSTVEASIISTTRIGSTTKRQHTPHQQQSWDKGLTRKHFTEKTNS
jgi:hypothetical protein